MLPPTTSTATRLFRVGARRYVDVWNSFLDVNGNYSAYGPDVNGQRRKLRFKNGISFTKAGNQKLAFFVAREIKRDFKDDSVIVSLPSGPTGPTPYMPGAEACDSGVGEVQPLAVPSVSTDILAGGPDNKAAVPEASAYYQVMVQGDTPDPSQGRADDFTWKERGLRRRGPATGRRSASGIPGLNPQSQRRCSQSHWPGSSQIHPSTTELISAIDASTSTRPSSSRGNTISSVNSTRKRTPSSRLTRTP